jgi:hypothetical protein
VSFGRGAYRCVIYTQPPLYRETAVRSIRQLEDPTANAKNWINLSKVLFSSFSDLLSTSTYKKKKIVCIPFHLSHRSLLSRSPSPSLPPLSHALSVTPAVHLFLEVNYSRDANPSLGLRPRPLTCLLLAALGGPTNLTTFNRLGAAESI